MDDYVPPFLGAVLRVIVCTPNKNDDELAYQTGVMQPTRRIREMADSLGDTPPTEAQIREAMSLLLTILETKQVDVSEREERIQMLLDQYRLHDIFPRLLPLPAEPTTS